jgi:glutamate racemase
MRFLVFDSGIGGLGVVAEIRRLQPGAGITYLADNGFYPYGEKPDGVLHRRILDIIGRGIDVVRPDAVVVACNTASTIALEALRAAYAVPFIGCVPPVKPAAAASRTLHIGLLATPATIRRPYLQDLIERFAGDCTVHSLGTPVLADLAEAKFRGAVVDIAALAGAISPLFANGAPVDAVALGCTHYTFLQPELQSLHPEISWFDPAGAVARQTLKVTGGLASVKNNEYETVLTTAIFPDHDIMAARMGAYGFRAIKRLDAGL